MKKKLSILIAVLAISGKSFGQYAYGAQWASYPSTFKVGTGFYSNNPQENFCLGYVTSVLPHSFIWWSNVNFWIQAPFGTLQGAYYVYDGPPSCTGALSQVTNGLGISAVESQLATSFRFALAGAYDKGCYFLTINGSGSPVSTMLYPWPNAYDPAASGPIIKPVIIEDQNGDFYICGSQNTETYVLKVGPTGTIIWSSFYKYNNRLSANDILVNPYNPNNVVVVGKTENGQNQDGFIMELDGNTGSVVLASEMGTPGDKEFFSTIIAGSNTPSSSKGFVIGGMNEIAGTQTQRSWVLKLDPGFNILWSNRIKSNLDPNAEEVLDVIERYNTFNQYEYFALAQSALGMLVYKLDDAGNQFPISTPNALNNEFLYNIGINNVPSSISYMNGLATGVNEGLHIFGSVENWPGTRSRHYVHAYFNGESPCWSSYSQCGTAPTNVPQNNFMPQILPGFTACSNFAVYFMSGQTGCNFPCQAYSSAGSNQRTMETSIPADVPVLTNPEDVQSPISVYPNPVKDKFTVSYDTENNSTVKIDLYTITGQHVSTIESKNNADPGHFEAELDLSTLNLASGIYYINATVNGRQYHEKINYTK